MPKTTNVKQCFHSYSLLMLDYNACCLGLTLACLLRVWLNLLAILYQKLIYRNQRLQKPLIYAQWHIILKAQMLKKQNINNQRDQTICDSDSGKLDSICSLWDKSNTLFFFFFAEIIIDFAQRVFRTLWWTVIDYLPWYCILLKLLN